MQHHKYSLTELDNMIPWEREVYVQLLIKHLKEEEERNRTSKGGAYAGEGNVQLRKMADPGTWK